MGLKLLHHKSWHVYNAVNIERVRKDEEEAAKQNEAEEKRTMIADSEARMSNLRKNAKKRLKDQQDEAEAALDRQLKGKGRAVDDEEPESRATIIRAPAKADSSIELDGHINFWADFERGAQAGRPATDMPTAKNAEHEAEAKKEKQKWEDQITMYIREPPKPWYSDPQLASASDRNKTADERLESVYKDGEHKRLNDPLAMMNGYLDRRDRVLDAQDRARRDPWMDTPKTLRDNGPIEPKLLRPKKRQRSPSPREEEFAPMRPPPAKAAPVDARIEAQSRESSERARAAALIAKSKRSASVASTPRSEAGYQDRYNPDAMRNLSHMRWDRDDERRHRSDDWRDRDRDRERRHYDRRDEDRRR